MLFIAEINREKSRIMGAGDHHRRDDSNQPPILEGEDGAAAAAPVSDINAGMVADDATDAVALTTTEDIWTTHEGYTPLQDMQLMNGGGGEEHGAVMFSHGGGGGTTTIFGAGGAAASGGAFLANLLAAENDDDEESSSRDNDDDNAIGGIPNFRDVADSALSLLEDDYFRTVQATGAAEAVTQQDSSISYIRNEEDDSKVASQSEASKDQNNATPDNNINSNSVSDFVDFESTPATAPIQQQVPDIDLTAVQRAVAAIGTRDSKLCANFDEWEQRQKAAAVTAPRLHPIIPTAPLSAFRRQTDKARQATANLSRSATIAEALKLFNLLKRDIDNPDTNILCIHIVGCDHVECESTERLRTLFGPIVRWIGAYAEAPTHLELDLIGPNVPATAVSTAPLDMMQTNNNAAGCRGIMETAVLCCHCALYEDWLADGGRSLPDLAIAFNAGCWGYREWKTTIHYLVQRTKQQSIPFVFTAYTLQEAEDDNEVIREAIAKCSNNDNKHISTAFCYWEPVGNPFSARQDRPTATALPGRQYRENAAWQGWRF